ncbi:MAG: BatA and WFA domain-containing protein [Anaerolineae bacterium]|nr:BatA and WFA domain-containing protein [Anaerolineae bacterium]
MLSSLSTLSFLTPVALILGALAIPIILLYMLRLRRTETAISSTFLWRQLVRDREANAPWQRLRPSWLLFLQLAILAAMVLALARPFTKVQTITTGRIVLLLDASASMAATDVEPDRFTAAREIGLEMVDTLGPDDTMTVIRVADVPEVLAAASRDRVVLREAIRSAEVSRASANWVAAMTLAAAGAVGVGELKVVIVSDGGLPPDLPTVPGDVRFVPVGEQASNLAISALAVSSLPGQPPQLFARISNYGDFETDVILDLRLDGSEVIYWAYRYTVPAHGYRDIFEVELPETFRALTARLTPPSRDGIPDYLAVDDVAYAVPDRSGAGRVLLVTEDNLFLRQIFRSLRGVQLFEISPQTGLPQQEFDLYVFDGWLPDRLPEGDLLIVNPPRSTDLFRLVGLQIPTGGIAVNRDDPRARNLSAFMDGVSLREFRVLSDVSWATALLTVDGYPLVAAGEVDQRQVGILAFDARYPNTDLVLQPGWVILIAELAGWFSPPRVTDADAVLPPGAPVTIRFIEDADEAVVVVPSGRQVRLGPDGAADVIFADTLEPGLYQVNLRRDEQVLKSELFAVNLFDPEESKIAPERSVTVGTTTVSRDAKQETGRREYWPWVAGIGLALLVVEWWAYHRSLQRIPRVTLAGLQHPGFKEPGRVRLFLNRLLRRKSRKAGMRRTRL